MLGGISLSIKALLSQIDGVMLPGLKGFHENKLEIFTNKYIIEKGEGEKHRSTILKKKFVSSFHLGVEDFGQPKIMLVFETILRAERNAFLKKSPKIAVGKDKPVGETSVTEWETKFPYRGEHDDHTRANHPHLRKHPHPMDHFGWGSPHPKSHPCPRRKTLDLLQTIFNSNLK